MCAGFVIANQLIMLPTGMAAETTEPLPQPSGSDKAEQAPTPPTPASFPSEVRLVVGELRTIPMNNPLRIVIGDPKVFDVTIASKTDLLLQAKAPGVTNLVVWDQDGQHSARVSVTEEISTKTAEELTRLLQQLNLTDVHVQQEGNKIFLAGQVPTADDLSHLEQLIHPYPSVENLVSVLPAPAPPAVASPPMIYLAVQMIEVDQDMTEQLGVKWAGGTGLGFAETPPAEKSLSASLHKRLLAPFRVGTLSRTGFSQTLNYLLEKNKARILAEPSLATTSGKQATSFMGSEIPVVSSTSTSAFGTSVSIEFKKVGVTLTMTPTILEGSEKISTILQAEVSEVSTANSIQVGTGGPTAVVPSVTQRQAQSEVTTASGETIVIAGLLKRKDQENVNEVPGLGDMPVVGRLFRSPKTQSETTELVIVVTPQLKEDQGQKAERTFALEQALSTAEVTSAVNDPRLRYSLQIQDRIAKALRYPQREREMNVNGRVKLRLHLFADGTLGRAVVSESSGNESLDAEALKAAESQAPYPTFPPQIVERELWLELPVLFRSS